MRIRKAIFGSFLIAHVAATAATATTTTNRLRQPNHQRRRQFKERRLRPLGVTPQPRVIGGVDAEEGRYPYNVALVDGVGFLICGGVLIAPDVVLTVAHCEGMSRAQIGRYDMVEYKGDAFDDFRIIFQYKHPFHTGYGPYEFNLLKLNGQSSQRYIQLNDDPNVPTPGLQGEITAMGFGITNFTDANEAGFELADYLQTVDLMYVPNAQCETSRDPDSTEEYLRWGYEDYITDDMMCAIDKSDDGDPQGDACMGDSGGPLVKKGASPRYDVLVGISSWGFECAHPDFPGVYSRVSDQVNWIKSTVCAISAAPPSDYNCNYDVAVPEADSEMAVTVSISFDDWPDEIGWTLVDAINFVVIADRPVGTYSESKYQQTVTETFFLTDEAYYIFSIHDEYGDGLNEPNNKPGSFQVVLDETGAVLAEGGGNFGLVETIEFQAARAPTTYPSVAPSFRPSANPSVSPSNAPTTSPAPSSSPTQSPTTHPSANPSSQPTQIPSERPSNFPTISPAPTKPPTDPPSAFPSQSPTASPTTSPSGSPSRQPSPFPTVSMKPSSTPTASPSSSPTEAPSPAPTISHRPTTYTPKPSVFPSFLPSNAPTITDQPSPLPTDTHSSSPTVAPTVTPVPSPLPSTSTSPSESTVSSRPSSTPSTSPTIAPTVTISPSTVPSNVLQEGKSVPTTPSTEPPPDRFKPNVHDSLFTPRPPPLPSPSPEVLVPEVVIPTRPNSSRPMFPNAGNLTLDGIIINSVHWNTTSGGDALSTPSSGNKLLSKAAATSVFAAFTTGVLLIAM